MREQQLRARIRTLEGYASSTLCDEEGKRYYRIRIAELKRELGII